MAISIALREMSFVLKLSNDFFILNNPDVSLFKLSNEVMVKNITCY